MPACPRCRVDLQPKTVITDGEWGLVTIDACGQCGGIWVDAEDQKADAKVNILYDQQLVDLQANPPQRPETDGEIGCPGCGSEMLRFDWNNRQLYLDRCLSCKGYWLDAGEAARISG
jgi:Zn-finger nucleic acid-binding protein